MFITTTLEYGQIETLWPCLLKRLVHHWPRSHSWTFLILWKHNFTVIQSILTCWSYLLHLGLRLKVRLSAETWRWDFGPLCQNCSRISILNVSPPVDWEIWVEMVVTTLLRGKGLWMYNTSKMYLRTIQKPTQDTLKNEGRELEYRSDFVDLPKTGPI